MSRFFLISRCIAIYLTQPLMIRFFLIITCMSVILSVKEIRKVNNIQKTKYDTLIREVIENVARNYRYTEVYRKTDKLPHSMKYILLWTQYEFAPFYYFGQGQTAFIDNNCSVINCYVTTNRDYFNGDLTKFDFIFFNGRNIWPLKKAELPKNRKPRQKYVYFNKESSHNLPVCNKMYDDFFNVTATYRLDSDIPIPYVQIRNVHGDVIGPKPEMNWIESNTVVDEELAMKLKNKTKAVAWFVSNCQTKSNRFKYVKELQQELDKYDLSVDIYGRCGPFTCPKKEKNCSTILNTYYFFYLSFENSFSVDYITEKLITALTHDVVPIVYGGADYSRFLPPGSYLNARDISPTELAATIAELVKSYLKYSRFFAWKNYYAYSTPSLTENVCSMCKALNEKWMEKPKYYKQFRSWWRPNFRELCRYRPLWWEEKQPFQLFSDFW